MHAERTYLFRHALLQRAAYELQPPSVRAHLHGLALEILERLFDPPPPELAAELADHAGHAARALSGIAQQRLLDRELGYLRIAGERALFGFRPADAIVLWRAALEHPRADTRGRMDAAMRLSRALRSASDLRQSLEASQRALVYARELGDDSRIANCLQSNGVVLRDLGRREESLHALREALATQERLGDTRGMAVACGNLALTLSDGSESNETLAGFKRAIELCRQAGELDTEAIQHLNLGATLLELGDYVQSEQELWLADQQLESLGNLPQRGVVYINLAVIARRRGQKTECLTHIQRALQLLRQSGYRRMEAQALNVLANTARDEQRFDDARKLYAEILQINRDTGNFVVEGRALCSFANFLLETGEFGRALAINKAALERLIRTNDTLFLAVTRSQLAQIFTLVGRFDEAEAQLVDAFALEREAGLEMMRCHNLMLPSARLELARGYASPKLPDRKEAASRIAALAKDPALAGDDMLRKLANALIETEQELAQAAKEQRPPQIFRGYPPSHMRQATRHAAIAMLQALEPQEYAKLERENPQLLQAMKDGTKKAPEPDWRNESPI